MKHLRNYWFSAAVFLVISMGGCHLEQGKLYFDEIGLDPITIYNMTPLERTVYCLGEIKTEVGLDFSTMYNRALEAVRTDPGQEDWSELVCLSLSGEADDDQLTETLKAIDDVLSSQSPAAEGLPGFKRIIEGRVGLYARLEEKQRTIKSLEQDIAGLKAAAERTASHNQEISAEQKKKIVQLEQQVRKLKEIELLLHPRR